MSENFFWNFKPIFFKDHFLKCLDIKFLCLIGFFYFAKNRDFIKVFAQLGQNGVKPPTLSKTTKSIFTG